MNKREKEIVQDFVDYYNPKTISAGLGKVNYATEMAAKAQ
jgi:hypothetical protein